MTLLATPNLLTLMSNSIEMRIFLKKKRKSKHLLNLSHSKKEMIMIYIIKLNTKTQFNTKQLRY